jgi:catechol 2,3-dioxygenase-like lactoylglutathione lyase family enzyme
MFDHVTIRAADRAASERLYDRVLREVGAPAMRRGGQFTDWGEFSLAAADPDHPPTTRLHIGFAAPSRAHADGWLGERPEYHREYVGAFVLDPDGKQRRGRRSQPLRGLP